MTTEYDVDVINRHKNYNQSIYAEKFYEFYESEHHNMKMDCETVEEAIRAQRILCMLISRKKIFDIIITRRKNVLYVIKKGEEVST